MADTWKNLYQNGTNETPDPEKGLAGTNKIATVIRVCGIILAVGGLIAAVVIGFAIPAQVPIYKGSFSVKDTFNFGLFFVIFISSLLSGILIIGFSEIIEKLSLCSDCLLKISKK